MDGCGRFMSLLWKGIKTMDCPDYIQADYRFGVHEIPWTRRLWTLGYEARCRCQWNSCIRNLSSLNSDPYQFPYGCSFSILRSLVCMCNAMKYQPKPRTTLARTGLFKLELIWIWVVRVQICTRNYPCSIKTRFTVGNWKRCIIVLWLPKLINSAYSGLRTTMWSVNMGTMLRLEGELLRFLQPKILSGPACWFPKFWSASLRSFSDARPSWNPESSVTSHIVGTE